MPSPDGRILRSAIDHLRRSQSYHGSTRFNARTNLSVRLLQNIGRAINRGVKVLGMIRNGNSLTTDAEGYIVDPSQWTEVFANEAAHREGITLTNEHWKVIRFMRAWLEDRGVAPDARHVMKFLAGDREAGRGRLFQLFPYGYVKQACKIAGMKKPRAWSTG